MIITYRLLHTLSLLFIHPAETCSCYKSENKTHTYWTMLLSNLIVLLCLLLEFYEIVR